MLSERVEGPVLDNPFREGLLDARTGTRLGDIDTDIPKPLRSINFHFEEETPCS